MALTKSMTFNGVAVPSAYLEVQMPGINADGVNMSFYLVRRTAAGQPAYQMQMYNCPYSSTGGDLFTQAYAWLLTQSEFSGATQV